MLIAESKTKIITGVGRTSWFICAEKRPYFVFKHNFTFTETIVVIIIYFNNQAVFYLVVNGCLLNIKIIYPCPFRWGVCSRQHWMASPTITIKADSIEVCCCNWFFCRKMWFKYTFRKSNTVKSSLSFEQFKWVKGKYWKFGCTSGVCGYIY